MPSRTLQRVAKSAALVPGLLRRPTPGLTVLLYHRVGAGDRNIDLSCDAFERQLAFLSGRTDVVTFDEAVARASEPGLDRELLTVTFDDGTDDFHEHVLPLIERYRVPALVYVSTGPVHERTTFPSWGADASDVHAMTWTQIAECQATGLITIGSHTHTHADLDRTPPDRIDDELVRSRALIEQHTQRPCRHFAYPHAVTSPEAELAVRRTYGTAAVAGWRSNPAGRFDPYRITRVPVTVADGYVFFRAKVAGRMAGEALLYRIGGRRG